MAKLPMVAAPATLTPHRALKIAQAATLAMPMEPGSLFSHLLVAVKISAPIPEWKMISPMRINRGTATRGKTASRS